MAVEEEAPFRGRSGNPGGGTFPGPNSVRSRAPMVPRVARGYPFPMLVMIPIRRTLPRPRVYPASLPLP